MVAEQRGMYNRQMWMAKHIRSELASIIHPLVNEAMNTNPSLLIVSDISPKPLFKMLSLYITKKTVEKQSD